MHSFERCSGETVYMVNQMCVLQLKFNIERSFTMLNGLWTVLIMIMAEHSPFTIRQLYTQYIYKMFVFCMMGIEHWVLAIQCLYDVYDLKMNVCCVYMDYLTTMNEENMLLPISFSGVYYSL